METTNLSTLKIHKLTQEQYDREEAAGRIDPEALYLTADNTDDIIQQITEDIGTINSDITALEGAISAITPTSIGALPITGGNLTGPLGVKNKYELGTAYHYTDGCLIEIGTAQTSTMVVLHITGNSYNSTKHPINSLFQFYDYGDGGII